MRMECEIAPVSAKSHNFVSEVSMPLLFIACRNGIFFARDTPDIAGFLPSRSTITHMLEYIRRGE